MQQIVLEVLGKQTDSMNGSFFERYKLKVLENESVFTTDGFTTEQTDIKVGHILDCMKVIGQATAEQLCHAYYAAKKFEEKEKSLINKLLLKAKSYPQEVSTKMPGKAAVDYKPVKEETLSIKKGFIAGQQDLFSILGGSI